MKQQLLGSWELISHGLRNADGQFKSTSSFLLGRLLYEDSGTMSVLIALKNPAETLSDIIAYSGRFSIKGKKIFHHIDVASRSDRIGTTEERLVSFQNDILVLQASASSKGIYEITWRKIKNTKP